ncbi:MAG: VWA domain-containing protein [Gammaproteobacteria bacterium]|nr:VWA domain-containing protein [Gammaproteobacteria bacterium]
MNKLSAIFQQCFGVNRTTPLGLSLLLLALICMPVHAEKNPILDVVLVMDSSGSMKKTDPRELRKSAAKLFISLLSEDDRVSVVSFSDQGYPVAYLTPPKADRKRQSLFAAVDKISNRGVYTNLSGAIDGALRVLNRNPMPNRKKIIVLMSDGKMDLGSAQASAKQTQRLQQEIIPMLKQQGVELHTIAFTPESDQATLEQIALSTGGKFNIAANDKQLHDVYAVIFEQNKQPNMLPFSGENFTIDKAITEVTVVGSKDSEKTVLSLASPDGKRFNAKNPPKNVKWFVAETFDLITIRKPQAGTWKLGSSTGKNKAYVITDLKMQLNAEPSAVAIGEGLLIKAWLEDNDKIITKKNILDNVSIQLKVLTPEGRTHELEMEPNPAVTQTDGVYINHIALPSAGIYKLDAVANAKTFSRERTSQVSVYDPSLKNEKPIQTTEQTTDSASQSPAQPASPSSGDSQKTLNHSTNAPQSSQSSIEPVAPPQPQQPVESIQSGPVPTPAPATPQNQDTGVQLPAIPATGAASASSAPPPVDSQDITKKPENQVTQDDSHTTMQNHQRNGDSAKDTPAKNKTNEQGQKDTKPGKKPEKDNRQTEKNKPNKDIAESDEHDAGEGEHGPSILTAILIFLGINITLLSIGGGVFYMMRKKKMKAAHGKGETDAPAEARKKAA